jgi:hypothetical protein
MSVFIHQQDRRFLVGFLALFGTFQHFSAGRPEEKFGQVAQVTQVKKFVVKFI